MKEVALNTQLPAILHIPDVQVGFLALLAGPESNPVSLLPPGHHGSVN